MVVTSFTGPAAGSTNNLAPVFYSTDSRSHWSPNYEVPGSISADQTVCFASTSGELYMATLQASNQWLNIGRASDPTAAAQFTNMVQYQSSAESHDQPYICAISVTNGPDQGKDRVYVGYNAAGSPTGHGVINDLLAEKVDDGPFSPLLSSCRRHYAQISSRQCHLRALLPTCA